MQKHEKPPKFNDSMASKEQGEDVLSSIEFDNSHLLHFVPHFEEVSNIDYAEYEPKIFEQFIAECDQDIQKSLKDMKI